MVTSLTVALPHVRTIGLAPRAERLLLSRQMLRLLPLRGLWALLLIGCVSDAPNVILPSDGQVAAVGSPVEYHVGTGDVLRVNVYDHPSLSTQAPVDGAGRIQLPGVGPVEVAGLTVLGVCEAARGALRRYLKDPRVDVSVVSFKAHRYVVLGEVRRPGVFPIAQPITALEALALAGGYSGAANRKQIVWMRGGLEAENLMMLDSSALDGRMTSLIGHGDVIYVGRRSWVDRFEAVRDVVPLLQVVTVPISAVTSAVTLVELLGKE